MRKKENKAVNMDIKSFLGEGTNFKGVLNFDGAINIDGKVEGEINSRDALIVGRHADISAQIKVGAIYIKGTIKGDISATERIEIFPSGKVFGNIKTPVLIIEEGVIFEGSCEMMPENLAENSEENNSPSVSNKGYQPKIVKGPQRA